MRPFLLFIGSVLYPLVMCIISPVLLFLYALLGAVLFSRFLNRKRRWLVAMLAEIKLPLLHFSEKKTLAFRPKAVRLH